MVETKPFSKGLLDKTYPRRYLKILKNNDANNIDDA